ncbi:hypothetical protein DRE_04290 [Drechslerella stenobrocha 248]|uniref:DUF7702 domain-containing protein n=1 Tax=Drechslerella stenobrocha 248 TaxID=1043628 RepID=W7I2G7_9PEZI|nr:hypothetical protein DRE_04290 [Drechslerella stenobrocha 248]
MAHVPFSSIEITSVIFLIVFTVLIIPSIYFWITYMRAGYPWRYGFWGAFLLCAARIACFISELIFYASNYSNTSAAIAFIVTLSIGFIGLLECEAALFASWAERHSLLTSPTQQQLHGKIRLLNIAALVLVVYGSTNYSSNGALSGTPLACIQAGTILFLVLTVIQALYLAYAWGKYRSNSNTLVLLSVTVAALLVRIVYGVYATFDRSVSIITFHRSAVKYLVGAALVPETVAMLLMVSVAVINWRGGKIARHAEQSSDTPEAYYMEPDSTKHRRRER